MKKGINFIRLFIVLPFAITSLIKVNGQTLLVENFDYLSGTALTSNGWNAHSSPGSNPVLVYTSGLAFPGYASSGIGLSASLSKNGEDVNRSFTPVSTGTIYCAFLTKVNAVNSDYFLHLSNTTLSTSAYRAKVFIDGTGSSFNFGLSKGSNTPTLTTGSLFTTGSVYLVVLKYSVVSGSANDEVSLFVFTGTIPDSEPALPTIGPLKDASQSDLNEVATVALRQYSSSENIIIDGIRVATTWGEAVSKTNIPSLTITWPIGGEIFVPGQKITVTWTSVNIENVFIEIWVPDVITGIYSWQPFVQSTPAVTGHTEITIPGNAPYGTEYKIRISDLANSSTNSITGKFTVGVITGSDVFNSDEIQLFPNPVTDELTLKCLINIQKIEILDLTGKVLLDLEIPRGTWIRIPVSNLSRGIYFLRVTSNEKRVIRIFIKS